MPVHTVSVLAANAMLNALTLLPDAGAAAATIEIRVGAAPATPLTADSGVLLATLTCSDPAFGAAAATVATANAITSDPSAAATGVAGHWRLKDSNGLVVDQGDVTVTGGGGAMQIDNINIVIGGIVNCTSFTLTHPVA